MTLARVWLDDHQPCTVQQYVEAVTPLMPKHICIRGHKHKSTQLAVAKEALRRLVFNEVVCIKDNICTTQVVNVRYCRWRQLATSDVLNTKEIAIELGLSRSQVCAFRQWLRNHGYCSGKNGVFTKNQEVQCATDQTTAFRVTLN